MKKIIFLIMISASCHHSFGQAGTLDPGFGTGGIVRSDFPTGDLVYDNSVQQLLLHPNGSFYLIFEMNRQTMIVHRFANGTLDPAFGAGGYSVPVLMRNPRGVLQPDGKIVVGGSSQQNGDFELARFLPNGALDLSFGGDGKLSTDFSSGTDNLFDLVIQSDGKIIAVGRTYDNNINRIALARYHPDGSPDLNFSGDGKQVTFLFTSQEALSIAIQNDGKLVVTGNSTTGGVTSMLVLRYLQNGTLDNTFSNDGYQTITSGWLSTASSIVLQADGKIIAGGLSLNSFNLMRFTLVRLNPDGSMDNSFSGDGKEITDFGGNDAAINAIAIQNDGRILTAGFTSPTGSLSRDFAVARYNSNGTLDPSFSGDGLATPDVTGGGNFPFAAANDMALLPDGKVLLAGFASHETLYAAVRLLTNGNPDNSFDGDGILRDHKVAGNSIYYASAIQPDGKIVTAGTTGSPSSNSLNMVVARYNTDGSTDNSFSDDGSVIIDFFAFADQAYALAIQPDGKILVTGSASDGNQTDFALVRLNSNGSFDNSFSTDGKLVTDFSGGNDVAQGIVLQPDGKIAICGYTMTAGNANFALARFQHDGSPDAALSGDGKLTTDFAGRNDIAHAILLQPDGKLVLVGESGPAIILPDVHIDIVLARYNFDGSPDLSFDGDGKITTDFEGRNDRANCAVLLPDGKIVVGGNTDRDLAFVRYNSNGSPDNSFSGDGKNTMNSGPVAGTIYSLILQGDGKIIAGGSGVNGFESDLVLARINPDGRPDYSFSGDGLIIMDFGYGIDQLRSLSLYGMRLYAAGATAYGAHHGLIAAFTLDCNINITIPRIPVKIEAENYNAMNGVQTEPTTDTGGGFNLGYIDFGDWVDYHINVPSAGLYTLVLRLATPSTSNPQFQVKNGETVLATMNVTNTGGFQNWQDVSINIILPQGNQTIRLLSTGGGYWNINWLRFKLPVDHYTAIPARIEAEDWSDMQGVQIESTADDCGGLNLGYIDYGDWIDYNIHVPFATKYTLVLRLATPSISNPQFQVKIGENILSTVNVPNTGGFQNWQDVTIDVLLPAGNQTIKLLSTGGGYWNINWLDFILPTGDYTLIPARIQAENWSAMHGVQTENTLDAGGGENVGYIDYGDWMDYKIQVPSTGIYLLNIRLATPSTSNPQFQVKIGEEVLATVNVPNTGGFQNWFTISLLKNLPAGNHTIRFLSTGGGYWNINWFEFPMPATFTRSGSSKELPVSQPELKLYPNPVNETTTLELNNESEGQVNVDIIGMNGNVLKQYKFNKGMRHSKYTISLSGLPAGTYMLRMQQNGNVETVKLLKL